MLSETGIRICIYINLKMLQFKYLKIKKNDYELKSIVFIAFFFFFFGFLFFV